MSEKGKPGVMLYFSFWNGLRRMSAEEKGLLVDGIVNYSQTGLEPDFDGALAIIWDITKPQIDADTEKYNAACERQREKANKRWNKRDADDATACHGTNGNADDANNNYNINSNTIPNIESAADKPLRTRFSPPSVEEVAEYCRERRNSVDPQRFVDYYSANGWMIGKTKMKDWKAAVRTWERNGKNEVYSGNTKPTGREANALFGLVPDVSG